MAVTCKTISVTSKSESIVVRASKVARGDNKDRQENKVSGKRKEARTTLENKEGHDEVS